MRYHLRKKERKITESLRNILSVNTILLLNHIPINVSVFSIFARFPKNFYCEIDYTKTDLLFRTLWHSTSIKKNLVLILPYALNDLDLSWITLTNITNVLAFIGIGLSKPDNLKNKQKKVSSFPLLFWRFSLWCINSLPINTVRETKVVEESSFSVKINGLKLKGRRFKIWLHSPNIAQIYFLAYVLLKSQSYS